MEALEIIMGQHAGRGLPLYAGVPITIGASRTAFYQLDNDRFLSDIHFEAKFTASQLIVRDLGSANGTFLNGAKIDVAPVKHGDTIMAGRSAFTFTSGPGAHVAPVWEPGVVPQSAYAAMNPGSSLSGVHRRACETILSHPAPTYVIFDSARKCVALPTVEAMGARVQSLYDGEKAVQLRSVAPYLIEAAGYQPVLEALVRLSWGRSCTLFLSTRAPFEQLRRHLRSLLIAETEGGRRLMFRFYDPRVARAFLPTCTVLELGEFFGPVLWIVCEHKDPERLLSFSRSANTLREEIATLKDEVRAA